MSTLKENKMGVMPVGRLLFQMALPLALSMLVQALYNVVDSVFVSQISSENNYALNAVSLAFPVQNIMIGIATGVSAGVNALLSRSLGEKNLNGVKTITKNGIFLTICGIFSPERSTRSKRTSQSLQIFWGIPASIPHAFISSRRGWSISEKWSRCD